MRAHYEIDHYPNMMTLLFLITDEPGAARTMISDKFTVGEATNYIQDSYKQHGFEAVLTQAPMEADSKQYSSQEIEINERAEAVSQELSCAYCPAMVEITEALPPAPDDDQAWALLAESHSDSCEWVITRAFRLDGALAQAGYSRLSLLLAALVLFLVLVGLAPLSGMAQRPRVVDGTVQGQQQEVKTLKKDGSEIQLCNAPTKAGGKCKRHVKVKGERCFSHKG